MGLINKIKQTDQKSRQLLATQIGHWIVIIAVYLLVFCLLDAFSLKYEIFPGVVAWYPPDGVSFAMLIAFGPVITPVVALASIISSLVIYKFQISILSILAWAVLVAVSYAIIAVFLRKRRVSGSKRISVRRMLLWMLATSIITTLLAIVSVFNLVQNGSVPRAEAFNATIQWWIGEMIGLLVFTPFLMLYVTPWLIRYSQGKRIFARRKIKIRIDPEVVAQTLLMIVVLYLVFGVQPLQKFHLHYLIAVPLIWVAIRHGFNRTSLAVLLTNFGVMLAVLLFKYQHTQLAEYQFLMFGIFFSVLIIGAITTSQKDSEEALRKKEILYRALVENASEAIMLVDVHRVIEYHSPAASRILGYDETLNQVGTNAASFTHPEDAPMLHGLFEEMIKTPSKVVVAQYRVRHRNGEWRWLESTFTNELNNPNIKSVVVNFRDITEHTIAEETMRQSEKRFRALVEQSQEEISLLNADGILTYESPNSRRPLGYGPDELIGGTIFSIFHPDEFEKVTGLFQRVAQNLGSVEKARFRVRHKDGAYRWMEGYISNMLDEPAVQSIVVNYSDITEQVANEQEIAVLAKIPAESPNPVLRMSHDGVLLYANDTSKAILELWGITVGEKVPQYMQDIASVAFARRENIPVEIKCEDKVYSVTVTPIIETGYINLYGRDITKRVRAEERLKESNEELSMLFELSHSLAEVDNLGHIFDIVNLHAVESMHHNTFARIALLQNDCFVMKAGFPARVVTEDFRLNQTIPVSSLPFSKHILDQNEPKVIRLDDPEIGAAERDILFIAGAHTLCLVPLRTSDSSPESEMLVGLLILGEVKEDGTLPYTPEKMRLMQTIGDSAAIAIRRILLNEQTETRMQQLVALSEIDLAIISNANLNSRLGVVCNQVLEQLKVDAVDIWIYDASKEELAFSICRGFSNTVFENARPVKLDEGMLGQAFIKRQTIHIANIKDQNKNPRFAKALAKEPFVGYYAVPLIANNEVKGVLEIFHRSELEGDVEWQNFMQILANQAAIAIDNSLLFNDLKQSNIELTQAYDATIQGWSRALDLRDNETEGHTQRVTELTMKLARMFGLPEEELIHVRRGALLHDIGKMGVPDRILLKPGPLTDEEWVIMRQHTSFAYQLLSPITFLKPALDIPMCHHEKWDGSGYPRGLAGDQIPFAARIFSVVDVWDALTSDRPYRAAWSEEKVLEYIKSLSGTQFDPQVVSVCLEPGFLTGTQRLRKDLQPMQWSEEFSVGVKELDLQHQRIMGMINRLISVTGTEQIHTETVASLLEEMTQYAQVHFVAEERLMTTYGFEHAEEHNRAHLSFMAKTVEFANLKEQNAKETADDLLTYLIHWWQSHILDEDMAYKEFFIERGLE